MKSIIREALDVYVCLEGRVTQWDIRDIIYVEHRSRAVFVYTVTDILCIPYLSLGQVHRALGDDYLFQCHRSFLVNRVHIERIDRTENYIELKNNRGRVSMGRKYRSEFLKNMHLVRRF